MFLVVLELILIDVKSILESLLKPLLNSEVQRSSIFDAATEREHQDVDCGFNLNE